jgi:2'-5' RNA ligase
MVYTFLGALAIPKHRINYFKYKNEIIWNKNTRFDNVFGSTGSNETIIDVIRRLENERFTKDEENEEPAHRLGRANRNVKNQKNQPNYFVSIPIRNKAIIDRLFDLNCDLLDSNIKIEKYILPSSSYHLTLCTLKINNDDEKSEVCQILKNVLKSEQVKQKFPITLSFKDVGEFYNKVFYVKSDSTNEIDKLDFIRRLVLAEFEKNQISTAGNYYEFVPHLTVFKIKKEKQVIDTDTVMTLVNDKIWTNYRGVEFGSEELNEFELCRMGGDIMVDKTYPVEFKYCLN